MSPPLVRFQAGGLAWASREVLREPIEHLCEEGQLGGPISIGETVKRSQNRVVTRLHVADAPCYLKRYRVTGARDQLKFALQRSRAEREWHAGHRLRELGISAVDPLAVGVARRGPWLVDAYFLSAALPGARLDDAVKTEIRADRSPVILIDAVVDLYQRLLAARVFHPDLHPGNLLVDRVATGYRIHLVGLHTLRFRHRELLPAAKRHMRANLAHSLQWMLGESDFDAALERLAPGDGARLRRDIEGVERRRLATRSRRCVRESSGFTRDRAGAITIWRRREVPLELLMQVTRGGPTQPVRLQVGEQQVAVRILRRRRGAGLLEWRGAHALAVRGIPAPIAYACLVRRCLGFSRDSTLVLEDRSAGVELGRAAQRGPEGVLEQAVVEVAHRHHRAGLRVGPSDLIAVQRDGAWTPERRELAVRPTDRPVSDAEAKEDLDSLGAALASGGTSSREQLPTSRNPDREAPD